MLRLPVAAGKSHIAACIARWQEAQRKRTRILAPTNQLRDQYHRDFPGLVYIQDRQFYESQCMRCMTEHKCKPNWPRCEFAAVKRALIETPITVSNYWAYMANRVYGETLIIDEAHCVLNQFREMGRLRFWMHKYPAMFDIDDNVALVEWLEQQVGLYGRLAPPIVKKALKLLNNDHIFVRTTAPYRNEPEELIEVIPLDLTKGLMPMWPPAHVHKIVLMSATVSEDDVIDMGLDRWGAEYYDCESPIPRHQRPVEYLPRVDMSYANRDIRKLAATIDAISQNHNDTKGLVHATYAVAAQLRAELTADRFIFHTKANKFKQFAEFRKSSQPKVLIASGMWEGVDLPDDAARWQVITQVPYASLADPVMVAMKERRPRSYVNDAAKLVIQASGRIVRNENDYGRTYIVDEQFGKLYDKHASLFPGFFKETLWREDKQLRRAHGS